MSDLFDIDRFPGKLKILFIGSGMSTHSYAWIDLLKDSDINVRLFALPDGIPPKEWQTKTYVTIASSEELDPHTRKRMYPQYIFPYILPKIQRFLSRIAVHYKLLQADTIETRLAGVIRSWKPDIIHTLGFEPASYLYLQVREEFALQDIGKWVAQVRGGPDFALNQYHPEKFKKIQSILNACDQFIADNQSNYAFAVKNGLAQSKVCPLGVVPGTGGLDVVKLKGTWAGPPSQRERIIVWPKVYEAPSSKALPVFEAIKIAWEKIKPCQIHMLWVVQPEIEAWYQTLSEEIRNSCHLYCRIPRDQVLALMAKARIMLAPSLTDGIPNSMLEAMALGAFPIVSPLETITSVVNEPENVLFARNLYPHEVAAALERAMTDDLLVDQAAMTNLELVERMSNRAEIAPRLIENYKNLVSKN